MSLIETENIFLLKKIFREDKLHEILSKIEILIIHEHK